MKIENLIKKDHYRSILTLLERFGRRKGLRHLEFLYALMDEPVFSEKNDFIKREKTQNKKMRELRGFFGEELKQWQTPTVGLDGKPFTSIVKGCIKSKSKLSNYLDKLKEEELVIKGKNRLDRYKLTKKYFHIINKVRTFERREKAQQLIKDWKHNITIDSEWIRRLLYGNFYISGEIPFDYLVDSTWLLHGVSYGEINENEGKIKECLIEIEKNFWRLSKLLPRSQNKMPRRLSFFYTGGLILTDKDKQHIKKVIEFFNKEESKIRRK
jgi:hypothetical protein